MPSLKLKYTLKETIKVEDTKKLIIKFKPKQVQMIQKCTVSNPICTLHKRSSFELGVVTLPEETTSWVAVLVMHPS